MYRGIHSHVMAMIEALINICETTDKVKWCFGNHDIHFLRGLYLPKYVLNEYIITSPRYFQIIKRMSKFALNNKTIHNCILSDGVCNIVFSHTIQSIEGLSKAVDIYNSLIKEDIIKDTKMILENINGDVLNQITREVLKIYIKTELDRLGFEYEYKDNKFIATIPNRRLDIDPYVNDIAEEIGRLYGYENLVSTLPKVPIRRGTYAPDVKIRKEISKRL